MVLLLQDLYFKSYHSGIETTIMLLLFFFLLSLNRTIVELKHHQGFSLFLPNLDFKSYHSGIETKY